MKISFAHFAHMNVTTVEIMRGHTRMYLRSIGLGVNFTPYLVRMTAPEGVYLEIAS